MNGYFICVEIAFNEEFIDFDEEFLKSYDFRTRPWYKIGEKALEPVFTDVYNDMEGTPSQDTNRALVEAARLNDFGRNWNYDRYD